MSAAMQQQQDDLCPRYFAPWTQDEDDLLRWYMARRAGYRQIAKNTGRSISACRNRAHALGLRQGDPNNWTAKLVVVNKHPSHHKPRVAGQTWPMKCLSCGGDFMSWDRAKNRRCKPDCTPVSSW